MADEARNEAGDMEMSDSPCLYIPTEILGGLAASSAAKASNDLVPQAPVMAFVPPSFEAEVITAKSTANTQSSTIGPNRLIYDMEFSDHEDNLPGTLARSEGNAPLNTPGDPSVDNAYDNFGIAWTFFHEVFNRDSIDNKGGPLIGIVNYGFYFPNATWSVSRANMQHVLIFGNGWDNDPWNQGAARKTFAGMFGGFVGSLEVVVHEMMHGITRTHVEFKAMDQPGALNEHLSDVFGVMAEQWHKGQTVEEADWLIGEDCLVPEKKGLALRSIINPGTAYDFGEDVDDVNFQGFAKDPQRQHWLDMFDGREDNFGVHINSGIPNKAFYLVAKRFGGKSWERAGQIWYAALTSETSKVRQDCRFSQWAQYTVVAAKNPRFGVGASEVVTKAWLDVGVKPRA